MSLNITKGEWVVIEGDRSIYVSSDYGPIVYESDKTIPNVRGDLTLIAEAGTVANETGLTPRQLLEQRDDLFNVLAEILTSGEWFKEELRFDKNRNGEKLFNKAVDIIEKTKESVK